MRNKQCAEGRFQNSLAVLKCRHHITANTGSVSNLTQIYGLYVDVNRDNYGYKEHQTFHIITKNSVLSPLFKQLQYKYALFHYVYTKYN